MRIKIRSCGGSSFFCAGVHKEIVAEAAQGARGEQRRRAFPCSIVYTGA